MYAPTTGLCLALPLLDWFPPSVCTCNPLEHLRRCMVCCVHFDDVHLHHQTGNSDSAWQSWIKPGYQPPMYVNTIAVPVTTTGHRPRMCRMVPTGLVWSRLTCHLDMGPHGLNAAVCPVLTCLCDGCQSPNSTPWVAWPGAASAKS